MNDTDLMRLIADGNRLTQIADLTGLPKGQIVKVARENGWTYNASADRFVKPVTPLAAVKPAPQTGVDAEQGKAGVRPANRDLIDEGLASSSAKVRRAAERARDMITRLELAIEAEARAEKLREIARLRKEAAEAQAKLLGYTARAVHTWAAANGVDCPPRGPVPAIVIEAYRAAVAA